MVCVVERLCCVESGGACRRCEQQIHVLWTVRRDLERYLRRRGAGPEDAADAVSEVYGIAWRRLGQVPDEVSGARGWLFITAWQVLANHRRRRAHQSQLVETLAAQPSPPAGFAATDDRLLAIEAMESLDESDRSLLRLMASTVLTTKELAEELECTATAAASRLWRARLRLQEAWSSEGLGAIRDM